MTHLQNIRGTTPEQDASIVSSYQTGKSLRDVAGLFGVSHETVARRIAGAGVALRGRGRPGVVRVKPRNKSKDAEIVRLYESGKTLREVGEVVGLSAHTIRSVLIANRHNRRRKGRR